MEAVFLRAPGRGGVGIEKGLDPFLASWTWSGLITQLLVYPEQELGTPCHVVKSTGRNRHFRFSIANPRVFSIGDAFDREPLNFEPKSLHHFPNFVHDQDLPSGRVLDSQEIDRFDLAQARNR